MFAESKDKGLRANPISVWLDDAIVQRRPNRLALIGFSITGFLMTLCLMLSKNPLKRFEKSLRFQIMDRSNNAV